MPILDNFDNFLQFLRVLTFLTIFRVFTIFDNFWQFWQILTIMTIFTILTFLTFLQFWQFLTIDNNFHNSESEFQTIAFAILTIEKTILETCDIWDTDHNSNNWYPEFIRNSCGVSCLWIMFVFCPCLVCGGKRIVWTNWELNVVRVKSIGSFKTIRNHYSNKGFLLSCLARQICLVLSFFSFECYICIFKAFNLFVIQPDKANLSDLWC